MTPPGTPPFLAYADLSEEKGNGLRRSARSRKQTMTLSSRPRTQRTRSSLEGGLRDVKRPVYAESAFELDFESSSDVESSSCTEDESEAEFMPVKKPRCIASCSTSYSRSHGSTRTSNVSSTSTLDAGDADISDRDELGKTPGRPQLRKKQVHVHPAASLERHKQRRRRSNSGVRDSDDDSQDELSFY